MAIEVGEIVATLKADTSQFTGGLDSANRKLDGFAKGLDGSNAALNQTGLGLVSIGGKITAAATAMGALGVAAAKEFGSFAEEMEMTAQKTGISIESLQKWNFALNRVGLEVKDLLPGFKKLSVTVTNALGGDDKAIKKIEHLGVSIEQLRGQNPEQIFLTLAGAIAKIDDPLARNAALTSTFGKAGMGLVPILGEVATGFAESGKKAEELGLVFSRDALASASALDDGFDDLTATMAGFSRTLASTFSGPLKDVIVMLTETLGAFNKWWQGLDEGTKRVVLIFTAAFAATGPIIAVIGAFMVAVSAGLGPLMVGGAIVAGVLAGIAAIVANWEALKTKAVAIWTGLRDGIIKIATDTYEGIKKYFTDKLMAVVQPVQKFADEVLGVFKRLRHEVVGGSEVPDMVKEIGDHMRMLDRNMTAPARVAAQGTWDVFRELAGKMEGVSRQLSTTIMSVWTSATATVSNALANHIIQGNNWKETMNSIATSVLSTFINLGIQLLAQKALELAMRTGLNAAILAGEAITATSIVTIWTSASGAIMGAFGLMTGAIMTFLTGTIIPVFVVVGEAVMTFLGSIATALDISIFGAPFSIPVWAAVAVVGAAIGVISAFAFGAFAEGGIVKGPMMGLVGEAGPEAIIPLDKLGNMMGGGEQTIIVQIGEREIARAAFQGMPSIMRVRGISA
jgi:hypothetical protein